MIGFRPWNFHRLLSPTLASRINNHYIFVNFIVGPTTPRTGLQTQFLQQHHSTVPIFVGPTGLHSGPHSPPLGSLDSQAGPLPISSFGWSLSSLGPTFIGHQKLSHFWVEPRFQVLIFMLISLFRGPNLFLLLITVHLASLNNSPPLWAPQRLISFKSQRKSNVLALCVHFGYF